MVKVLITGGLGFIGSNLAIRLMKEKEDVTLVSRTKNKIYNLDGYSDYKLKIGDITDKDFVESVVSEGFDYIFHLAGQVSHFVSLEDPIKDIKINNIGTMNILQAAVKYGKPKVIFASTRGVYGKPCAIPVNENTPTQPLDIYGANKLACEKYCYIFHKVYGLPTTCLRFSNVYGPRQQVRHGKFGILNYFIRLAIENKTIFVYGNGNQLRDYTYITDAVDALIKAKNELADGEVFLIGSGKGIKFVDMVKKIIKINRSGSFKRVPYPELQGKIEIGDFVVDPRKAKKILNWEAKTSLDDGIYKTIEFYEENLAKYLG